MLSCNGELYGFRKMRESLKKRGYSFHSDSDCEILLPMYREFGPEMFRLLDAEFALVLYDARAGQYIGRARPGGDPSPLLRAGREGLLCLSSEPKSLVGICARIRPFPPGHYAVIDAGPAASEPAGQERKKHVKDHISFSQDRGPQMVLHEYRRIWQADHVSGDDMGRVAQNIHDRLLAGIKKRLDADAPVGLPFVRRPRFLAGLRRGGQAPGQAPPQTFAIGMDVDAIDLKYARKVAEYIGSDHHEVIITREDVLDALDPVIAALGTWDITTIRASIGMYLVCKWIHENTDIRVILTGEISDEIFGYKYNRISPRTRLLSRRNRKKGSGRSTCTTSSARTAVSVSTPWRPRALRGSGLSVLLHVHRPGDEAQPLWDRQISPAPRL